MWGLGCGMQDYRCIMRDRSLRCPDSTVVAIRRQGTWAFAAAVYRLSCSTPCRVLVPWPGDQGSNQYPLHYKVDPQENPSSILFFFPTLGLHCYIQGSSSCRDSGLLSGCVGFSLRWFLLLKSLQTPELWGVVYFVLFNSRVSAVVWVYSLENSSWAIHKLMKWFSTTATHHDPPEASRNTDACTNQDSLNFSQHVTWKFHL